MIQEISAKEMESRARVFVSVKTQDMQGAKEVLKTLGKVKEEEGYLRIYDVDAPERVVKLLYQNGHIVSEVKKNKIGLEEYYVELMSKKEDE